MLANATREPFKMVFGMVVGLHAIEAWQPFLAGLSDRQRMLMEWGTQDAEQP